MILRLWIRLFLLVLACIIPLGALNFWQQRESLRILWHLNPPEPMIPVIENSMRDLRQLAALDTANQQIYQQRFEALEQTRSDLQTLTQVSNNLTQSMLAQVLRNVALAAVLGVIGAFFIARKVVRNFSVLRQKEMEAERLQNDLSRLQGWQNIARTVVHELRAPLAPVQILSESLVRKYQALPAESFAQFLAQASTLLREQAAVMQRLIENFTTFAKLPEPQFHKIDMAEFLRTFVNSNKSARANLVFHNNAPKTEVLADSSLLQRLFYNLLRNALEANPEGTLDIEYYITASDSSAVVNTKNSGKIIPQSVAENLFGFKQPTSAGNKLGLGLTIVHKIALDHKGSFALVSNSEESGVIFELTIPRATS
jgi:signal transduction histidine kinase